MSDKLPITSKILKECRDIAPERIVIKLISKISELETELQTKDNIIEKLKESNDFYLPDKWTYGKYGPTLFKKGDDWFRHDEHGQLIGGVKAREVKKEVELLEKELG